MTFPGYSEDDSPTMQWIEREIGKRKQNTCRNPPLNADRTIYAQIRALEVADNARVTSPKLKVN